MHAAKLPYRYASAEPLLVCYSGENDNDQASGTKDTARTTCEIRLNPRTFHAKGGVSDNAVQNVYTAVCRTFVTFRTVQRNA